MERREFIQHSVLVAGAVVVGLPLLNLESAFADIQPQGTTGTPRSWLYGSPQTGCARYVAHPDLPDFLIR